jgi:arylformamidase
MLYDISRTIAPSTAVWEGDTPYSAAQALDMADGASVNLTTWQLSPHTATHADATFHFQPNGSYPDAFPLEKFIGEAVVVTVQREQGGILPADVPLTAPAPRVLLRTWVSDLPDSDFAQDFPYATLELVDWLADQGAVLLGVDMPSVDDVSSKTLPCHNRLHQRGMVHLENVLLRDVPDGVYELIALPLKVTQTCASPVRAILRA